MRSSTTTSLATTPARPWRILTLALLALATIVAFAGVLSNGWILLDDPLYVTDDVHVRSGLTWQGFTWFLHAAHVGNWHPLTSWSHMLDVELFGLSPRGPHAVNLALHVVNACLLLLVLAEFTGAWWRSALVAAVFALHPLRVESVAWISERKDVLSTFLFLVALAAYRRWAEKPSRARWVVLVSAFVLGLMAKPMLVTLPFVLVLLDIWPLGRIRLADGGAWKRDLRQCIVEKWPLFALAAVFAVVTLLVQDASGATSNLERIPLGLRVSTALAGYAWYVHAFFVPHGLAVYYPYPASGEYVLAAAVLLGLIATTIVCLRERGTRPYLLVGWLWFLGTLVPVIGLVQVGGQAHADRYTYIPMIGLGLALVWGVCDLVARRPAVQKAGVVCACTGLVLLTLMTRSQVLLWRDTRTLFAHTLAVTQDNAVAHKVLADALRIDGDIPGAIVHLQEAVRISPTYAEARKNLGSALGLEGRFAEAVEQFGEAARTQPSFDVLYNLGCALSDVRRFEDSIEPFERALALAPDSAPLNSRFGRSLASLGRWDEALPRLRRALELDPEDVEARRRLAIGLMFAGDVEAAVAAYRLVLQRVPDDLDALDNIAWIRATHPDARHRNGDEAVTAAERARDTLKAPDAAQFNVLAAAYAEAGRFDDAVVAGTRAVELARAAGAKGDAEQYARQLENYRARKPFHMR